MKKILKRLMPVFLCIFCFAAPVCTAAAAEDYSEYDFTYPYVIDSAKVLSNDSSLYSRLKNIGNSYGVDIVVVTVDSLGGKTATAFADDFYDYNGYSNNGILFLLSMEYRDWAISTKGSCIRSFTDYGCNYIFDQMKPYLSDKNFEGAFNEFAVQCEAFLAQAESGKPYDTNNEVKGPKNYLYIAAAGIFTGLIAALVVSLMLKGQLKSVKFQSSAASYLNKNSVRVTQNYDMFLYKTLSKTKRESSSSSGGGGGGSSTHRSSSGSTHGGSSGKW